MSQLVSTPHAAGLSGPKWVPRAHRSYAIRRAPRVGLRTARPVGVRGIAPTRPRSIAAPDILRWFTHRNADSRGQDRGSTAVLDAVPSPQSVREVRYDTLRNRRARAAGHAHQGARGVKDGEHHNGGMRTHSSHAMGEWGALRFGRCGFLHSFLRTRSAPCDLCMSLRHTPERPPMLRAMRVRRCIA